MNNVLNIKTFSEKIGVSVATVSRAFGARGRISDATRKRILAEAELLGYRANFHASNLSSKSSGSVCFFYPEIYLEEPDYFMSEIVFGVKQTLKHDRVFKITPFDETDDRILDSCKAQILDGRVSAAIIAAGTPGARTLTELAEKRKIPYVVIGKMSGLDHNIVDYDNGYGAEMAGRYFRSIGRKHPAYITGHLDRAKRNGFAKGFGVELEKIVQIEGGAGFRYGSQAMELIAKNHPKVDCVLCANDNLAIGVIKAAARLGVKIPKQLSVIGFDDIAIARNYIPAISTVSLHLKQLGILAVELLEKQFQTGTSVPQQTLQCDLILREST